MVVNEISKERKSLARSMRDVDSAIRKLDDVLVVVVFIITIFIFISFLNTELHHNTCDSRNCSLIALLHLFSNMSRNPSLNSIPLLQGTFSLGNI